MAHDAPHSDLPQSTLTENGQQAPGSAPKKRFARQITNPMFVFWLMFGINTVNFLDRTIVVAVAPTLKQEFRLVDAEIGVLASAFLVVYTFTAVPLGFIADRYFSRARVVAIGLGIWSLMSTATGFVRNFAGLLVTRAGVGVGEASYYPAGTALLSSYFSTERRARIMSIWQSAQLIGTTLAFALAAVLDAVLHPTVAWRVAFIISGVPGLILAVFMWFVADAPHGGMGPSRALATQAEPQAADGHGHLDTSGGFAELWGTVKTILRIRTLWLVIILQAFVYIIVTPALAFLPIYIRSTSSPFHLTASQASIVSGVVLVVGGLIGTLLGGRLADLLSPRIAGGRVLATAIGFAFGLPSLIVTLTTTSLPVFIVAGICTVLGISIPLGPLSAAAQDVTPPALRASALAVTLLLSHVLGDFWSPSAVGGISTALGERPGAALMIVGIPALALATVAAVIGSRFYAAEAARVQALERSQAAQA